MPDQSDLDKFIKQAQIDSQMLVRAELLRPLFPGATDEQLADEVLSTLWWTKSRKKVSRKYIGSLVKEYQQRLNEANLESSETQTDTGSLPLEVDSLPG
jgi:hypothetical protein